MRRIPVTRGKSLGSDGQKALIAAVAIVLAERTRPRTAEEGAAVGALKPAE